MLKIIFGAGASYDSYVSRAPDPRHPEEFRPPLTNELFQERAIFQMPFEQFDKAHPLIGDLRDVKASETVEEVLERVATESSSYSEAKKQLAAVRYYIQSVIWLCERKWHSVHSGATNHKILLNCVERWRSRVNENVFLVTFNYDTLIEKALSIFDLSFESLHAYIRHPNYKVIKLHGSVNWVHPTLIPAVPNIDPRDPVEVAQRVIRNIDTAGIRQSDFEMQSITPPNPIADIAWFPAIAIPIQGKQSFECPQEHVTELKAVIPKIDKLIVVGWRGLENHFTNLLQEIRRSVSVLIVARDGQDAAQTTAALRKVLYRADFPKPVFGFSDFVRQQRTINEFLSTQLLE